MAERLFGTERWCSCYAVTRVSDNVFCNNCRLVRRAQYSRYYKVKRYHGP